jgi:hypothetical protein
MKILTKEEEQAHYDATVKGGSIGGLVGLIVVRTLHLHPLDISPFAPVLSASSQHDYGTSPANTLP